MTSKKFYITTAIAYPNSAPHLGHALEIIQTDVSARFHKLLGKDVFFQTGTDEHGVKNWQTAKKEGKDIYEFLDSNVKIFKDLYEKLNVSYDYFIRTTDKKMHHPGVIKLWKELVKSGDLYKKKYAGLYCSGCEAFKTERELEDGKCPNHPTKDIDTVEEENYFFKLSKYKEEVAKNIESDEYKVVPTTRKNEILSWLKEATDISFSRPKSTLPWGIPVPGDSEQVMYVWCDALSNYITGVGYGRDDKKFSNIWPADIHVIGKDILRFHAAFWPAMLISANVPLPKSLFVHGFILSKGAKMSKSTGNVIEPFEQINKYGVDQFRFYIMGAMPIDSDGDYSEDLVVERVNTELVGNVSNLCYRVLSFTNKNFDSSIKDIDEGKVIEELKAKVDAIKKAYLEFDFKRAVDEILGFSAIGNRYLQENEPWKLLKSDKEKAHKILGLCVNIVKNLSILIEPIVPGFSSQIQKQLNVKDIKWEDINFNLKNHKIGKAEIVIKKVEVVDEEKFPLDLKVAKIESVEDHPSADKLFIEHIDCGEKRQIVSGLKDWYKKEDLVGKNIVIVSNLKAAKLRGVESKGMLLAAEEGELCEVLFVSGNPGDKVGFDGLENSSKQINIEQFAKIKMKVKDKKVYFNDKALKVNGKEVKVDIADGVKIC
ncbi:MAG: methionine--tRNA ligase [Nanoarchaeota archaeon]|nr:methionine--tRNA ligase [Nanoarchaeota archaeon]